MSGQKTAMAPMQEKNKAYTAHFNPDWVKEWPALIAKSHKGDTDAFCRLCRCYFSVSTDESKTYSVTSLIVTTKGNIWYLDWAIQVVLFSKIGTCLESGPTSFT